jgi:hypothetical protein
VPILAPVPLLSPGNMLHVYEDDKDHIMQGAGKQCTRGASQTAANTFKSCKVGEKVILYHSDRSPQTYAEMDNILNVQRKIILTLGNGTSIKGAIMNRTRCLGVFRNKLHLDLVRAELKAWLIEHITDPADARFHRAANADEPMAEDEGAGGVPVTPLSSPTIRSAPGSPTLSFT